VKIVGLHVLILIFNYQVYIEIVQQIAENPLQIKATHAEAQSITNALANEAGNRLSDSILELCSEENKHDE